MDSNEALISFTLSDMPIRVTCVNCDGFVTQSRNIVVVCFGGGENVEHYLIGEKRIVDCCKAEVNIPLFFASHDHMQNYVASLFRMLANKSTLEVMQKEVLITPSEEVIKAMRLNVPNDKLENVIHYDTPISDSIEYKEGIGLCDKNLH